MKIDELIDSLQKLKKYIDSDVRIINDANSQIMVENNTNCDDIEEVVFDRQIGKYYIRIKDPTIIKVPK